MPIPFVATAPLHDQRCRLIWFTCDLRCMMELWAAFVVGMKNSIVSDLTCSWANATIPTTESCPRLTQYHLRAWRSQAFSIDFQPLPKHTHFSQNPRQIKKKIKNLCNVTERNVIPKSFHNLRIRSSFLFSTTYSSNLFLFFFLPCTNSFETRCCHQIQDELMHIFRKWSVVKVHDFNFCN